MRRAAPSRARGAKRCTGEGGEGGPSAPPPCPRAPSPCAPHPPPPVPPPPVPCVGSPGMNYLHTLVPPVVHRDLKSPNVLVNDYYMIKLCDFGMSRTKQRTVIQTKQMGMHPVRRTLAGAL